jgi:cytochrome P450
MGEIAAMLSQAVVTGQTGHRHHHVEDTLRSQGPLHQAVLPSGLRVQVVTAGYEQTRALLADPRLSKDSTRLLDTIHAQLGPTAVTAMHAPSMVMSDPPHHTRLRKLVANEFTTRRVTALRPRIEHLASTLLDAIPTDHPADLIHTVAYPLPIAVVGELLGVPRSDHEQLRTWTEHLMQDDPAVTLPASDRMTGYLHTLITTDRPGLLAALSRELPPDELITMAMLLVVAGHETTTNLIGNAIYALLTTPERWRAVAATPALAAAAVEETLRWDPPVRHATHRVSTEPIDIAGHVLPPGEVVLINLGSAGRDPHTTTNPTAFDLHRPTRPHVAFGHGIHFCLGAHLARMEAEICLTQLTTRWPQAHLAATDLPRTNSAIMNGLQHLPVHTQ